MNSMSLHTSLQSACITHADAEWPPQSIRALIPSFDSRSQAVLAGYDAVLEWQSSRWQLTCLTADMSASPVFSEFVTGKARYRRTHGGKEALVQALRIAHTARGSVVDAAVVDTTAGLGRDAFILASHGFQVTLLERVPAIAWLLWDGLRRARDDANVSAIVDRMLLHVVDALTWLQAHQSCRCIWTLCFRNVKRKHVLKKTCTCFIVSWVRTMILVLCYRMHCEWLNDVWL